MRKSDRSLSLTALLQRLVRIPSVSPGDRAVEDDPTFGEGQLANFVAGFIRDECGLEPEIEYVAPDRPAVWRRLDSTAPAEPGGARRKTLLLEAHLDTVAPDPLDPDPFGGAEHAGSVHGLGSADCKASLAVFLVTLREMAQRPERLKYNLVVAGAPDEEHAMLGSRHLARRLADQLDFAICGEPTGLAPVTRHKGLVRWRITAAGRAAHSSTPELGDNAVYRAARIVSAVEAYAADLAARAPDPQLGRPTASVTGVSGGTAVNIVPSQCRVLVDRRLVPGESADAVEQEFVAALAAAVPREPAGASWEIERIDADCPPLTSCEGDETLAELCATLKRLGLPDRPIAMPFGTDASVYAAAGCPAIVWGPGDICLSHSKAESIKIAEVQRAAEALLAFVSL